MTFKYKNVYLGETATVTGPYEEQGPLSRFFDKSYQEFYFGSKTWEQAESKLLEESIEILLNKMSKSKQDIDVLISGDLSNQLSSTNYAATNLHMPLIGIYGACSTSCLGILLASNMIDKKQIKDAIVSVSSHNNAAEKQFRQPVEYGGPKPKTATFTVTGGASCYLSGERSNIKVTSATLGIPIDMGIKDAFHMGAVMAPAAAETIMEHLRNTYQDINDYDLILTGDLGRYGKDILKDYLINEYGIEANNIDDAACMIYNLDKQKVYAGGSGPACLPLVTYGYILNKMNKKMLKKVLLVATGALMSLATVNEKMSIPAIAHAVSLEVVE